MTRFWKISLIFGAVSVAVVFGFLQSGIFQTAPAMEDRNAEIDVAIRDAQSRFAELRMQSVEEFHSPEDVRRAIGEGTVQGAGPATRDADVNELRQHVAELIYFRFLQDSPQEYVRWRESGGYRRATPSELAKDGISNRYELLAGRPFPAALDFEALFSEFWSLGWSRARSGLRMAGIASESKGIAFNFSRLSTREPTAYPWAQGEMSTDEWHGKAAGGHQEWWKPPGLGFKAHLKQHGFVDMASVAVVLAFADGERYPIRLLFSRDSSSGRWWIEGLHTLNHRYERFPMLDY